MKTSAIGWTDYSGGIWNIVTGCTPVDQGCANCYARAIYKRWGRDFSQVVLHPDKLAKWRTAGLPEWSPKRGAPHKPMVFVVDMGDLGRAPDGFIWDALDAMDARRDVIWQLLTKRPYHLAGAVDDWLMRQCPRDSLPPNVWVGVSVCDQETLNERLPVLADIPAKVKFLSVEPMLGPVSLAQSDVLPQWVICGAESGGRRRRFDREWAQELFWECEARGIPFFGKQDWALRPGEPLILWDKSRIAKVIQQWPEEVPNATQA